MSWADVEVGGGMSKEYLADIDSRFRSLFGQGMAGDIYDSIRMNRDAADQFMQLINSGSLEKKNGKIVIKSDVYRSNPTLAKYADNFGYVDQEANAKYDNEQGLKTKWKTGIDEAKKAGYITEDQYNALNSAYAANPEGAQAQLNTWVQAGLDKTGEDTSWKYVEPEFMKKAKEAIAADLALNPTFNTQMVNEWMPTLLKAQEGAKTQEYGNNAELMNSMGRMFSGQTLQNSQDINNKYTMDALQKALGYASSDYADQMARKTAATDKSMAIGQYETGISQYKNDQDVAKALQGFMQNWNTINTNKSQNYNDLNSSISRIYANEDWTKNADLSRQLTGMTNQGTTQDWEKWLQPIATVGAAFI